LLQFPTVLQAVLKRLIRITCSALRTNFHPTAAPRVYDLDIRILKMGSIYIRNGEIYTLCNGAAMKYLLFSIFCSMLLCVACNKADSSSAPGSTSDSPTEAYKRLYAAVKNKNTDEIKSQMSSRTLTFADSVAAQQNKPIDKVFENGFTATTFSPNLPEIRDERVNGEMGAVEVYNSRDSRWEDLPFVLENGKWKLAIGEMFANTYKSPGKGRAQKEAEAANSAGNNMTIIRPNVNVPGMTTNTAANTKTANAK
jgi:hypothetical protein